MKSSSLAPLLLLGVGLTGCGMVGSNAVTSSSTSAAPAGAQGKVMGGQQPVAGAAVQLFAAGTTGDGSASTALLTSVVTSDASGNFSLTGKYSCTANPGALVYLTATGGNSGSGVNNAITMMTALGACSALTPSTNILINERTTVAAVSALEPFMNAYNAIGSSALDASALASAWSLASAYVNSANGAVPGPNLPANAVVPEPRLNGLANILAACVNSTGATGSTDPCGVLFAGTTEAGSTPPANTLAATVNLMRDPGMSTATLFGLASSTPPFQPQPSTAPADWSLALTGSGAPAAAFPGCDAPTLVGTGGFTDFTKQQPAVCRKLTAVDLPAANTGASSTNYSTQVTRVEGQMPLVPPGFKVTLYAFGFLNGRYLALAPNGDLFLAEPGGGTIVVLRGVDAEGRAQQKFTFATGLTSPYGLAFYPSGANPQYLYVANTSTIVRFPYTNGDTVARAAATTLASDIPNSGNHTTRALAFTADGQHLLVSVGSSTNYTNTDTDHSEFHRADILSYTPLGVFEKIYASGLRNPVGLVVDGSGVVWTSVNERDGLGDNTPADYVTHVQEDGFYGWPWYYNGANAEPRLPANHTDLATKTIVGDVLLQPHFAPLQINFYTGTQFPAAYRGNLFVASHGSWNKATRGGYELVRVPVVNGVATGVNEDFMTGFVNADGTVWGRPAGVVTGADGALYVMDDASDSIWRVTYTGSR